MIASHCWHPFFILFRFWQSRYPIFFTVDSFAIFFLTIAIYWLVRIQRFNRVKDYLWCGLFFGLALASKISIFTFIILFPLVGIYNLRSESNSKERFIKAFRRSFSGFILTIIVAFFTFRLCQPDAFNTPGFRAFFFSERWISNLNEVRLLMKGIVDYFPSHQWANRIPLWHPWINMMLWGMGITLGLTAWIGLIVIFVRLIKHHEWEHLIPVSWSLFLFLYMGIQFVKPMRYLLPIYPMMALIAAWILIHLLDNSSEKAYNHKLLNWTPKKSKILIYIILIGTLIWAFAFLKIYCRPYPRIEASRWIYENIPKGSILSNEHWDDPLPLRVDGKLPSLNYKIISMEMYNDDTPEKLEHIANQLDEAEYLILSSNRLYDSISRLPMRYPMTIKYYEALFKGSLGFEKIAEFISYPGLFGISIPDQLAEEPFTVYDHPKVQIFKKTPAFDRQRALKILGDVNWECIVKMLPKDVFSAPTALMLTDNREYRNYGTWSKIFNRQSFSNYAPVISWVLLIQILGLLGAPYLFLVCKGLPDGGYSFSKLFGLLLVGWLTWISVSLHISPYSKMIILLVIFILGLVAFILTRINSSEIRTFLKTYKRVILFEEVLFWLLFSIFLLIRYANPDLWHPFLGGEKPMDFAYLNAVIKSKYFPPYDPWFAEGYINYYYFGFVLWGTLIKISGITPSVAYNLIIPSLFAMTAIGAFGISLALIHKNDRCVKKCELLYSLLGMLFVSVIGNLGTIKLISDAFTKLSSSSWDLGFKSLTYIVNLISGFIVFISKDISLPVSLEHWYWNPTRLISHAPSEAGPINEFPWFTYLFADLHAHAMALPLTLLALGLGLVILKSRINKLNLFHITAPALVLGGLWTTNTWDLPTYAFVILMILILYEWSKENTITNIFNAVKVWLIIMFLAYIFYYPYHKYYAFPYTGMTLWKGSHTPLTEYLLINGFFLYLIIPFLITDFLFGKKHNGIVRTLKTIIFKYKSLRRFKHLQKALIGNISVYQTTQYLMIIILLLFITLILSGQILPGVILIFLTLTILLFFRCQPVINEQITLLFIGIALLLSLTVEFITLSGDIGRMNTVFKFYLQVWVLFGLSSISSYVIIIKHFPFWPVFIRRIWIAGFIILFFCVLLYPVTATKAKIKDRFVESSQNTLDGMACLEGAVLFDKNGYIKLIDDKLAIEWLLDNVEGSPVVVEANPSLYSWGSRVSMFTGLPSIIGWDWHQKQQRAILPQDIIDRRLKNVEKIYNSKDPLEAYKILKGYNAEYLVVGTLERAKYNKKGLSKFNSSDSTFWKLVYDTGETRIYKISN